MSVLLETELGLTTTIPNRLPLTHFRPKFTNPLRCPLDVVSAEVSVGEIVGHVHQRLFAERVNQPIVVNWLQIESILAGFHKIRAIAVEPYWKDTGWRR